jgi:hypothetical protein
MATKIICRASDCIFWEDKLCTSDEIIYDPEEGCLTYEVLDDLVDLDEEDDENWDDDELLADDDDVEDEDDDDLWDEDDLYKTDDDREEKWQV